MLKPDVVYSVFKFILIRVRTKRLFSEIWIDELSGGARIISGA